MPSVNAGPSNSQTVNVTADLTNPVGAGQLGSAPATVAQSAIPIGIAPTGSIGANGALTMGTAMPVGTPFALQYQSAYFYFPAGATYSGSQAGFYFTKMSSTTAGIVYRDTWASTGTPIIPSSPVAISDPGPGAYTGVTTAVIPISIIVPGNAIGANGSLSIDLLASYLNSAGSKTLAATFGGSAIQTTSQTTTASIWVIKTFVARGLTNDLVGLNGNVPGATANAGNQHITVDTTQSQPFNISLTVAVATDFIILEYFRISTVYGP